MALECAPTARTSCPGLHVFRYRLLDCTVASEIACPELPEADGEADIRIRLGAVPERLSGASEEKLCFSAVPGEALVSLPGIGRFQVRRGEEIVIEPAAEVAPDQLRVFLLNLVFGVLLLQRGELVLHAAVVECGDGCIALAGESGAGKSTIAAALHARGLRVLSDEFCLIRNLPGLGPSVIPGPPYLQVWADALHQLGHDPARLQPVRAGLGKHLLPLGGGHANRALPLRTVHVLSPWNGDAAQSEALSGPDRMDAFIRNTYRFEFLRPMGLAARHFGQVLQLAEAVPAMRLRRPGSWRGMEQILELLPIPSGRPQLPTMAGGASRTIE